MVSKSIRVGATVSPKHAIKAYYSNYAGNPSCYFEPTDIGIIASKGGPKDVVIDFFKDGVLIGQNETYQNGQGPWRCAATYEELEKASIGLPSDEELSDTINLIMNMNVRWGETIYHFGQPDYPEDYVLICKTVHKEIDISLAELSLWTNNIWDISDLTFGVFQEYWKDIIIPSRIVTAV